MKVLVVTNSKYRDFIIPLVWNHIKDNKVHIHIDDYKYDFSDEYDIGVSFMYQYRVPKEQIDAHPWINFHPGPLPMYRGRNLCYHAIMNGEKEFGATVHYMDENFDTGDIIWVQKFPIFDWYTAEDLSNKTIDIAKKMFIDQFPHIVAGKQFDRHPNVGGEYHIKDKIPDVLDADPYLEKWVRAVTYKQFYPKINIHGVTYKIVRDE